MRWKRKACPYLVSTWYVAHFLSDVPRVDDTTVGPSQCNKNDKLADLSCQIFHGQRMHSFQAASQPASQPARMFEK